MRPLSLLRGGRALLSRLGMPWAVTLLGTAVTVAGCAAVIGIGGDYVEETGTSGTTTTHQGGTGGTGGTGATGGGLPIGSPCGGGVECQSGWCADGVCCNEACDGLCVACSAAISSGPDGVCSAVPNGTPDDNCPGAATCQNGACVLFPNGTACTLPAECQSTQCIDGFCCDTACDSPCQACGHTKTGQPDGTCASVVNGTTPDADCPGTVRCQDGACAFFATGTACNLPVECQSGSCVDGVCCDAACGGTCQACIQTRTGQPNGTCAPVTNGTNPDADCPGAVVCQNGACALFPNGTACALPAECQNSQCVEGLCCSAACGATCESCLLSKTGQPDGTCAPILASQDPDSECGPNQACDGQGACAIVDGQTCALPGDCISGFCPLDDLVCCNVACDAADCVACVAAKNGGTTGVCGNIPNGQDPDNDCPGQRFCMGNGICSP